MVIREASLTDAVLNTLIAFSRDWEKEQSCYGYRANGPGDIAGNRVFLALEGEEAIGYLFGHGFQAKNMRSIIPDGAPCFEVEELYVIPARRSRGVGKALFDHASRAVRGEADFMVLSTATKNFRAILHFYIDELGMDFWSARLYKRIGGNAP